LKQKIEPAEQEKRQQDVSAKVQAQYQKAQERLVELVRKNASMRYYHGAPLY
jgi:outer membrane protein insertion porin family